MMDRHPDVFFAAVDELVRDHRVVIDRPRGSRHPRYPDAVYPIDYGYLDGTTAADGEGVDVFVGDGESHVTAVVLVVDTLKGQVESKLLLGCSPGQIETVLRFLASDLRLPVAHVMRPGTAKR